MTLAQSGANSLPETTSAEASLAQTTPLDCDILTVARDAQLHAKGAQKNTRMIADPMDALYKPLGNKDVACVLKAAGH